MKEEENEKQEGQENKKIKFSYQSEWIFSYLHLMSLEKVILNKFSSNKKSIYKIISFKKYFDKQNIILNNWLQLINELLLLLHINLTGAIKYIFISPKLMVLGIGC